VTKEGKGSDERGKYGDEKKGGGLWAVGGRRKKRRRGVEENGRLKRRFLETTHDTRHTTNGITFEPLRL
jgi:hypothetical protein